eukprot:NODE_17781_length_926_cov_3.986233.p2 GENE.NODE_17781_length_926_cov_3.986233~~NODE_17781_length_926_cov_3.986233.p2  ORF type:complete len:103 (-),score=25.57 NODE_17781_length_926_cov_3.986233:161-469(-)
MLQMTARSLCTFIYQQQYEGEDWCVLRQRLRDGKMTVAEATERVVEEQDEELWREVQRVRGLDRQRFQLAAELAAAAAPEADRRTELAAAAVPVSIARPGVS